MPEGCDAIGGDLALSATLELACESAPENSLKRKLESGQESASKICTLWRAGLFCNWGKCEFAHTDGDPTPVRKSNIRFKRDVCPFFKEGFCGFGKDCFNLHSEDDSNATPSAPSAVYCGGSKSVACHHFKTGVCEFGKECVFLHESVESSIEPKPQAADENLEAAYWSEHDPYFGDVRLIGELRLKVSEAAGICFFVDKSATEVLHGPNWAKACELDSGPMRVRIVGNVEDLGLCDDRSWDPHYGIDLVWERDGWRSMILQVAPGSKVEFCVVRLDQPESHPGVLQGWKRSEVHASRRFSWSAVQSVEVPALGQVVEVSLSAEHCARTVTSKPNTCIYQRQDLAPRAGSSMPRTPSHSGRQSWYTFDGLEDVVLNCSLYLPPDYLPRGQQERTWPLCIFLHSMHARLDGDNSLFYESDTPLRLLQGNERCPRYLRDNFIMLSPQCPPDYDRPQGAGIWLRHGWYETSEYAPDVETALMDLIETVSCSCNVDRDRIVLVGSSMGAYGALELASRRPNIFSALGLVAAHYDLEPLDPLVERLIGPQTLPLWFFHAKNDAMCPSDDIELLVSKLQARSKADVRFTFYEDTWSKQGHCADRVAFFAEAAGEVAYGEEFFEWLASQKLQRNKSGSSDGGR